MKEYNFKFIDLFAGIGGFHQAMVSLGGQCVMAAEIDEACRKTYLKNYKINPDKFFTDINKVNPKDIDEFDVLCAGFPCQPFSKAGKQKGFQDEHRGNLFYKIMDILDAHEETKFVFLENVRNLADKTENWDIIKSELLKRNFYITEEPLILSPSDFGIPQRRERVYILGIRKDITNVDLLHDNAIKEESLQSVLKTKYKKCKLGAALKILEEDVDDKYLIPDESQEMILAWDELLHSGIKKISGAPIWVDAFGVNYDDYEEFKKVVKYDEMKEWKQKFYDRNREFFISNKNTIIEWIEKYRILERKKSYRKCEWQAGEDAKNTKEALIQIRQSGIRIKRTTYFPSLVAIINTSIVWDYKKNHFRYITPREAANLQNFKKVFTFEGTDAVIYKQLGNSVNVQVLKYIGKALLKLGHEGWDGDINAI